MARSRIGRQAIDAMVKEYKDGLELAGPVAVRAFVISTLGVKPSKVSLTQAGEWERQARYELADELVPVTSPVGANKYLRTPNADSVGRRQSRDPLYRGEVTRLTNMHRLAVADASQPDASAVEIERKVRLEVAAQVIRELV